MGAYVSVDECRSHYNVTVNCSLNLTGPSPYQGEFSPGEVPPDPDIAGIGIVSTFIGITSFALAISIIHVFWTLAKGVGWKYRLKDEERDQRSTRRCARLSLSRICEKIVLSCSDQQVFTGGAYALTLRYWKGCSITAYHYNIVANMMLLTCATHLMSVAILRNYWEYPWLALLRVLVITGVFLVTGILLANQNADVSVPFPTAVPPADDANAVAMFLPAACFQKGSPYAKTILDSLSKDHATETFLFSNPGNHVQGWNFYLVILFCYAAAIIVDVARSLGRGMEKDGLRASFVRWLGTLCCYVPGAKTTWRGKLVRGLYALYLIGSIGVSAATVILSGRYMMDLRAWVKESHWLEDNGGGQSEEDDGTSFGQLVPVFLCLLTLFTFAQTISEMGRSNKKSLGKGPSNVSYYRGQVPNSSYHFPPDKAGMIETVHEDTVTPLSSPGLTQNVYWDLERSNMLSPQYTNNSGSLSTVHYSSGTQINHSQHNNNLGHHPQQNPQVSRARQTNQSFHGAS